MFGLSSPDNCRAMPISCFSQSLHGERKDFIVEIITVVVELLRSCHNQFIFVIIQLEKRRIFATV